MTLFKLDGRITGTRRAEDQLAKYLREPPIADIEDPIEYYYSNSSRFPDLARFALDYLSIPGMCHFCIFIYPMLTLFFSCFC